MDIVDFILQELAALDNLEDTCSAEDVGRQFV